MSKYSEMASITRVLLERELDIHRQNLNQSRQIEGELAQIDVMRTAAQSDGGAISARQILGADTLWQGWLLNKRADVLRRAAGARALELVSRDKASFAFSRLQAVEQLIEQDTKENLRKRELAEAETIEALGRLKRALDQKD
ncbi:hypothetical protein [Sagittula sp. SSi028]|uniref:hypothetical protein n=1 Tax=Sagittula sp. SSi028 TaxID=3400636 RepID=UPI003AF5EA2F